MAANQIPNKVGATVFAVLCGLSAISLGAWHFTKDNTSGRNGAHSEAIAALESQKSDLQGELDAESARRAELALKLNEAEGQLLTLRNENQALLDAKAAAKAQFDQLKLQSDKKVAAINRAQAAEKKTRLKMDADVEKTQLGVSQALQADLLKLQGESQSLRDAKAAAEAKFNQLKSQSDNEIATLKQSLDAEKKAGRQAQLQLKAELEKMNQATGQSLQADQLKLQSENQSLLDAKAAAEAKFNEFKAQSEQEITTLKQALKAEKKASQQAQLELNAKIEKMQQGLDQALHADQLKPAGDFPALELPFLVSDPIQLDGKVRPVFIELRGMKDSPSEMKAVYDKLTQDGNTEALHKVPFSSGSADVSEEEGKKLETSLAGTQKSDRFLVVGYASTDGDPKTNYELSSKRASSVANKLATMKGIKPESIQAVYFGQTKRFSENYISANRVVEIWRVK